MSLDLTFKITGTNTFLADVGALTLKQGGKVIMTSQGFSGGRSSPEASDPLPSSTYHIRLNIRQVVNKYPWPGDSDERGMHHWYGIEKIDVTDWQWEWGGYRAALNERDPHLPRAYRGNFLHGKQRPDDYTHGCICERSEQILQYLWTVQQQSVTVNVER